MSDVIVVGAGPAGLMAAGEAARNGHRVQLYERNSAPGRKLNITGKGRCNLTNDCDREEFLRNIRRNPRFLYSALAALTPRDTMNFFEGFGVPLKVERGHRVFPVSDRAQDVTDALTRWVRDLGVVLEKRMVTALVLDGGRVVGVDTSEGRVDTQAVILATGGLSYPKTGSDGNGFTLAAAVGHSIVPPAPSLIPLTSDDRHCAEMQGLSLRNVELTLRDAKGKSVYTELGEMLFTHFGVSGPLVLSASAHMQTETPYCLTINLKPGLDADKLDARLLRDFVQNRNRAFRNCLDALLPKTMIPVVVSLSGIPPETRVHSVTRTQRQTLAELLRAFPVSVSGTRPIDEAIVTSGGVDVRQVNPKTMESKLVKGLYFAGEMIDVDGYTGGFNLQIAWSTGKLAGQSI